MGEIKHFDIIVNIPLEEELEAFLNVFEYEEDIPSAAGQYRCSVKTDSELTMLVILQDEMGKSSASNSITEIIQEYSCNLFICLGISGGLSKDLKLGDVCYSGNILDVNDNAKTTDGQEDSIKLELSPHTYRTNQQLAYALNLARRNPELRENYKNWQHSRYLRATELGLSSIADSKGKNPIKAEPKTICGTIVCGVVSAGVNYNKKLKDIDRNVLAIETESGGIFNVAARKGINALTIRGISDYADPNKEELETKTGNVARLLAAENAASFLMFQLSNPKFVEKVTAPLAINSTSEFLVRQNTTEKSLEDLVIGCQDHIDSRLRELSPEFRLHPKGYQMPLPSLLPDSPKERGSTKKAKPIHDIVDCLKKENHIYLALDKSYPDKSIPWVIADHLVKSEIDNIQLLPVVVDGNDIKPPHYTIELVAPPVFFNSNEVTERQIIIIFDGLPLSSKTRTNFIIEQITIHKDAKFIFIDRAEANIFMQSEFATAVAATAYRLCDVSFSQMAYFVQSNFDMSTSESEVIAMRLQDTFRKFHLNAHPSYFAAIPKETLSSLIKANRRTELMQLGVDGFMTFLVAGDQAKIALSRTTRSKYLRQLVVEINVNKRNFTEAELVNYTAQFADHYDFDIKPMAFIDEFMKTGILYIHNGKVCIAIPFIENFLLAQELSNYPELAMSYFELGDINLDDYDFDIATFDLYCEINPCSQIVAAVIQMLENSVENYNDKTHVLLSDEIDSSTLLTLDKLGALQGRIDKAAQDISEDKNTTVEKQRLLDITERVTERTSKSSITALNRGNKSNQNDQVIDEDDEDDEELDVKIDEISGLSFSWVIGTLLVGYGAEHLDADKKRLLVSLVLKNAALLIDRWTIFSDEMNFVKMKDEMTSDEFLDEIMQKYPSHTKPDKLRSMISDYVDLMKYVIISDPFRKVIGGIGEHAKNPILGKSLSAIKTDEAFCELIRCIWITDLELGDSGKLLNEACKKLPEHSLLMICVSEYLLNQVYWSHTDRAHRLKLLDIADKILKSASLDINKAKLQRDISKE